MRFTYFTWGHVIVRSERFDFLWHWPSRYFSLIIWRWGRDPRGLFRYSLGLLFKPWSDAWEVGQFYGVRIGRLYIRSYFHRAKFMREWLANPPKPDADGFVLLPAKVAVDAVAAELERLHAEEEEKA